MTASMEDIFAHMLHYHASIFLIIDAAVPAQSTVLVLGAIWSFLLDDIWRCSHASALVNG